MAPASLPTKPPEAANVLTVGDTVYEDSPGGPSVAAVEPSAAPAAGRPLKTMLRIKLRGASDGSAQTVPHPRDGEPEVRDERLPASPVPEDAQSFVVLADRLTVDSGRLSLWHAEEVVFCCPVAALASIAFEALGNPRLAPSVERVADGVRPPASHGPVAVAGQPEDPYVEAHRDLASANTRWTAQDERRLVELHEAGVSIDELARTFGRRKGAVRARLFKLRRALEAGPDVPTA